MYLLHFYFIWDIGLYLRTSLHFSFYFRTYTYLQLMGDLDMYAFYIILLFFFFFCFNKWNFEFKFFLSNPLGHRNHEGLGVENTLQIGKGVWNPSDHAHAYKHVCTEALTVNMHSGPCAHMPPNKEALANLFYYKIAVRGLQTFIKCVLFSGIILQGSQWQNALLWRSQCGLTSLISISRMLSSLLIFPVYLSFIKSKWMSPFYVLPLSYSQDAWLFS